MIDRKIHRQTPTNDINKAMKSVQDGAKAIDEGNGKYAIQYPTTGGHYLITKTVYNKLKTPWPSTHPQQAPISSL